MKKLIQLFCLITILSLPAYAKIYDLSVPLEGKSIVSDKLQFKIASDLFSQTTKAYPNCTDICISDTQIIHYPYDAKMKDGHYVKGYWKELWTINACNTKVQIPITFHIKKTKTKYVQEKKIERTMFP